MQSPIRRQYSFAGAAFLGLALFNPGMLSASTAGGGTMPWNTPLQTFVTDLTGPTAGLLAILAFFVAGVTLIFGGEISEFVRRLVIAVLVASMLVGIVNLFAALGITGAVV